MDGDDKDKQVVTWLMENIREKEDSSINVVDICRLYEEQHNMKIPNLMIGRYINKLFLNAKSCHRTDKETGKRVRAYKGLLLQSNLKTTGTSEGDMPIDFCNIVQLLPHKCMVLMHSNTSVTFAIASNVITNSNIVLKHITLNSDSSWCLSVRGKTVNLQLHGISNKFQLIKSSFNQVIQVVERTRLCIGGKIEKYLTEVLDEFSLLLETNAITGNENSTAKYVRSKDCKQLVPWGSNLFQCTQCQYVIRKYKLEVCNISNDIGQNGDDSEPVMSEIEEEMVVLNENDTKDMEDIFEKVFPDAPDEMKILLSAQQKALKAKNKKSIRWDKRVIAVCLGLWVRSPKSYQDLKDSKMLILPSGRQLRTYKNIVRQEPGLTDQMCRWMLEAAKENKLDTHGYAGGIIHDETKVQSDVVIEMRDGKPQLMGWVDTGEEAMHLRILKEKKVKQTLATSVLQVTFLGYSGFRFPICHYPCLGIKASELHTILWDIIAKLQDWGFTVDYIMSDGGEENRSFTKIHFTGSPVDSNYLSVNLVNPNKMIAHVQDFSHNIKKIRNGILSSGPVKGIHTRHLQKATYEIVWDHWKSAVAWDKNVNSRPISHKITDSHLNPNSAEKMRNSLAEQMLDEEMLYLMESYQANLLDGEYLNGSISLLKQTSKLIKFFRDKRPIHSLSDDRLSILGDVFAWFQEWKSEASSANTGILKKNKMLLSWECMEDIDSMLLTFKEICKMHWQQFPNSYITPSRFNSDVVENHFCQERGLHNGNNTNPTYSNYCANVNSIILGQSLKSRGRKSNAGISTADSFSMYVEPVYKKKKSQNENHNEISKLSKMR